jgi:hypothetical protein
VSRIASLLRPIVSPPSRPSPSSSAPPHWRISP